MQKLKKVAIGGISKECGTYSPLFQTEDDFEMIQGTRLVDLGIELKDFRLLVVKSGYLSPELQSLLSPSFLILSDGAVCQNFDILENKNRHRPIFPFQNRFDYVPEIRK